MTLFAQLRKFFQKYKRFMFQSFSADLKSQTKWTPRKTLSWELTISIKSKILNRCLRGVFRLLGF